MTTKGWWILSGILGSTLGVPGVVQAAPIGAETLVSILVWIGAGKVGMDGIRLFQKLKKPPP